MSWPGPSFNRVRSGRLGRGKHKFLADRVFLIKGQIAENLFNILLGIFEGRNPVMAIDLGRPGIVSGQGQFLIPIEGIQ